MDRNFNGLSERFNSQIYGTLKGQLRLKMLDLDLHNIIKDQTSLDVLDAGGGMGQFSSALLAQGHQLTLTDISQDMLNEAKLIHQEVAPSKQAHFICGPLQALPDTLEKTFDLVLNHAVLEWLSEPLDAIETLQHMVKDNGHLSLMFYNRHAIVWRNLMNGSWQRAHNDYFHHDKNHLMPQNPLDPQQVLEKALSLNLKLVSWRGIRCIHDHMPKFMRDKKTLAEFVEIESSLGLQAPYRDLGRYVHMLFQKKLP
ncbi:tRNA uridine 5-oxyacetic acid(34) methyltransferase CmoM [Oceaniserpentilla sp. 4NH20-0058]|uniref:methyltransferase domain-containing protein n=1 Tax=Oceaniserpentilla sp. 4NH20-0058 TaxID=3127660 RepID=UPI003102C3D0